MSLGFLYKEVKHEKTKKFLRVTFLVTAAFILSMVILVILAKLYLPPGILSAIDFSGHLEYSYYGYFLIFIITFLGGTFFPVGSPAVVATAGALGFPKMPTVIISSVGYTLGVCVNYFLAYELGTHYVQKRIGEEVYEDLSIWWNKYGIVLVILFALFPILPFNLLALLCGLFRFNIIYFILINFGSNFLNSYIFVYLGSSAAYWIGLF